MLQLPLPSKPIHAARRTSREPLKLQNPFSSAQKVPPGGVNGVPEDELEELLLDEELEELEDDEELLLEEELLEELEVLPPPQPMGASATTISSIHTSAS